MQPLRVLFEYTDLTGRWIQDSKGNRRSNGQPQKIHPTPLLKHILHPGNYYIYNSEENSIC